MAAAQVSHYPAAAAAAVVDVAATVDASGDVNTSEGATAKANCVPALWAALNDPRRNVPTKEETAALKELKAHLRKHPLKPIGSSDYDDFFLLKFVIAGKCRLEKTYTRLTNYHGFRLKYKMDEMSNVEAIRWAKKNLEGTFMTPGMQDGVASSFLQFSNFYPDVASDDLGFLNLITCGNLYLHAYTSTLQMARAGHRVIISMEGFGWKNSPISLMRKLAPLYQDCFPVRIVEINMVNPPMWVNAIIAAFKMFMKKKLSDRVTLAWDKGVEDERLLSKKFTADTLPDGMFHGTNKTDILEWLMPFAEALDEEAKAAKARRTAVFAGKVCTQCDSRCCDNTGARIGGAVACSVCGQWYCEECRDDNLVERKGKGVFKHKSCIGKKSEYKYK